MFPIVLVHGIARFDIAAEIVRQTMPILPLRAINFFQYFKGIAEYLAAHDYPHVFEPNLDFAGPSELRAGQLKAAINEILRNTGSAKVHIIAHSMGGLDARRMISTMEMSSNVASLTTIGTPHLGTALADYLLERDDQALLRTLERFTRLNLQGVKDLTTESCLRLNERLRTDEAANGVVYQTYASLEPADRIFTPLVPSHRFLLETAGENDGLVPVVSQRWTSTVEGDGATKPVRQVDFPFPADHLNQTGWWDWEERDGFFDPANPLHQRRAYEDRVKAVYFEIAESVKHLS